MNDLTNDDLDNLIDGIDLDNVNADSDLLLGCWADLIVDRMAVDNPE